MSQPYGDMHEPPQYPEEGLEWRDHADPDEAYGQKGDYWAAKARADVQQADEQYL